MRRLKELNLKENERKALEGLKERILERFPDAEIILYGSKVRGESDEDSDIDLLIILNMEVDDSLREEIFGMCFKVELEYDVIFGILVEAKDFWYSPRANAMPIHWSIDKEGVLVR